MDFRELWMLVLASLLLVASEFGVEGDEEVDPECEKETSQLMKHMLEPSSLPYTEPDVETTKATFGMGCFWGVEAVFGAQPGVIRVKAGYTGGQMKDPTYKYLGDHFEVVEIEYDATKTDFPALLELFWANHDPTFLEKGKSSVVQYMSGVFYHNEEQKRLAEEAVARKKEEIDGDVLTKIQPAEIFYNAEDYHQKYFLRQHQNLASSLGFTDSDFLSSSRTTRLLGYVAGYGTVENFVEEANSLGLSHEQIVYLKKAIRSRKEGSCASKGPLH